MENKKYKVYLASGWFTKQQKETMDKVRKVILTYPELDLFSPYYDGVVLNEENDSPEKRQEVFDIDIGQVAFSDLVVAVIDDFDPGAMFEWGGAGIISWLKKKGYITCKQSWEQGCSYVIEVKSILSDIKILAYTDVSDRGLNVMLQQSIWGFANGTIQLNSQLYQFINRLEALDYLPFEKGKII